VESAALARPFTLFSLSGFFSLCVFWSFGLFLVFWFLIFLVFYSLYCFVGCEGGFTWIGDGKKSLLLLVFDFRKMVEKIGPLV